MRKPLRSSTFCFFTRVVVSDDQGIEGWSNEVTADMAHALRGEVRESLIGADAIARKKTGANFRAGSTTHPALQNPRRLENGYVRMPEGPDLGVMLEWEQIDADRGIVVHRHRPVGGG